MPVVTLPLVMTSPGDLTLDFAHRSASDFTGVPAQSLLGRGWEKVIHPDDVERLKEASRASIAGATDLALDVRCQWREGIYRWVNLQFTPIFEGGKVTRWLGTAAENNVLPDRDLQYSVFKIAHDLISPLTAISMACEELSEADAAEFEELRNRIRAGLIRMRELIQSLSELGSRDSSQSAAR